jgi:Outer membrane protein beta-barrel domain
LVLSVTMAAASPALADLVLVAPFVGGNGGGAASGTVLPGADTASNRLTYGVALDFLVTKHLGAGLDVGQSPDFFGDDNGFRTDRAVSTFMGNATYLVPVGTRVVPYAAGGAGAIRFDVREAGGLATLARSQAGWNAGGGVLGYVNEHVGVRGDVRYFRTFENAEVDGNPFGVDTNAFDFWRLTTGVVFRF